MGRILKYLSVGVISFGVEYVSFIILYQHLFSNINILVAQTVSFILGLITSYTGNRNFTFKHANSKYKYSRRKQIFFYFILSIINLIVSSFVIIILVNAGLRADIAKLITILIIVLWNLIIYSNIVFKQK